MALLTAKKTREEEFPLFNYRRLVASTDLYVYPKVVFPLLKNRIIIRPVGYVVPFKRLRVTHIHRRVSLDDSESRIAIWRALFKDKSLPRIEEGAVEKYAGSLDKYLPENVPVDNVVTHAKKG
jgi:hypothetical protein